MVSLKRDPYRELSYFRLGRTILRSDTLHIRMILPELLRRVGTFDAHAAHHAHFGTVGLSLGAVSDWQRDAGVVIGRIETGDQIKRNEPVHVTRSTRSRASSISRGSRVAPRRVSRSTGRSRS